MKLASFIAVIAEIATVILVIEVALTLVKLSFGR